MEGSSVNRNEVVKVGPKGKACLGCLYYSSVIKSKSKDPACIGVTRHFDRVPGSLVQAMEKYAAHEGRNYKDYKYSCVGRSFYLDRKGSSADLQGKQVELPFCSGIELVMGKKVSTAEQDLVHVNNGDADRGPMNVNSGEDDLVLPKPRPYKPPHSGEEFFSKFTRNASLVASGVSRNMNRVGRYIKANVDDILYPYRRRPK
ncbi:hypothetical protein IFM89_014766 [Coptis chinensis]|uniref:DUF8204 domain-containing protein n=1 Tax=Coptis chinensis TaxID=261450 RepID=A0A835MBE7_9MAGN|nr:hypothetical protein IFM89_014766 [Coptis chinensis]